jgi:hypothetical protein
MNTRIGKIARLPLAVRDELNQRLENGEPGIDMVAWLNSLPAVRQVLQEEFGCHLINEVNLSAWKQGGYQDWLGHQETRERVRNLVERLAVLRQDAGDCSLADLYVLPILEVLDRCLTALANDAPTDPEKRKEFLDLARELSCLRRGDHNAGQLRLEQERLKLDLERFQAQTCEQYLRWFNDERFKAIVKNPHFDHTEKLQKLRRLLFEDDDTPPAAESALPPDAGIPPAA